MKNELSQERLDELLDVLEKRFKKNMHRHEAVTWENVRAKLEKSPGKLWSLSEMEETGGEPDVVGEIGGKYLFFDCSPESPKGRRSVCYDHEALESRKQHKPGNSAWGMAEDMGIKLLTEEQYGQLQKLGKFDTKTSSWLDTPPEMRKLGGAIFGDWRFGRVFIYHNGAESYYGARGFRGALEL